MDQEKVIDRIIGILDDIRGELRTQGETMIKQQSILDEHVRRSLAAEKNIEILREQIKPLQENQSFRKKLFEMFGVCAMIAGFIYSVLRIFKGIN